jgi:predicted secreted protein
MIDRITAPSSAAVSRRRLLGLAAAATAGLLATPAGRPAAADDDAPRPAIHRPRFRLPAVTSNGGRVPITVEAGHPLDLEHGATTLEVVNPRDPVPLKGVFHFTPANGRAYVAFQARFDEGPSTAVATADCRRHGRFSVTAPLVIAAGGGGCAGTAPALPASTDLRPPVIRIPRLVADGGLRPDEVVQVQVKTEHPNRTGLVARDGGFVQESEPFHLTAMEIVYGGQAVSRFVLGAALSDNPLITFTLRPRQEGTVRVVLTNTRNQRFEASHPIRFA